MKPQPQLAALSPKPVDSSRLIVMAPVRDECFGTDSTETSAMQCSAGAASRIADTLQILLSGAGIRKRADNALDGERFRTYRYAGHIGGSSGGPGFHVLDVRGHELTWVELINALTGDSLVVASRPVIAPDGARFAVGSFGGVERCGQDTQLQVWRITGDKPVREFSIAPFNCRTQVGWGPANVQWRSRDSISFVRLKVPRDSIRRRNLELDSTRALLVNRAEGWVMEPKS